MFRTEDVIPLKDDERIRTITRRHVITLFPGLGLAIIFIVIPFFLLFPLFSWGLPGVILFFASLLLGLGIAFRVLLVWDSDVLIVTTLRLVDVDQRGLFTRIVTEAPLSTIQDVSWSKRGIIETVFGLGSVRVQTAAATASLVAQRVPRPQVIHELINELRHYHVTKTAAVSGEPSEHVKKISTMLQNYSPDELERIETVLKARERSAVDDESSYGEKTGE
jgi:membrane protein YdbS with pleckstrin-like domain